MWGYYNGEAMSVDETYWFETKEEAMRFVQLAMNRNMEEYPNDPYLWPMIDDEWGGVIFEASPTMTAEEAFAEWFGEED